jgi:hypothetical protein
MGPICPFGIANDNAGTAATVRASADTTAIFVVFFILFFSFIYLFQLTFLSSGPLARRHRFRCLLKDSDALHQKTGSQAK